MYAIQEEYIKNQVKVLPLRVEGRNNIVNYCYIIMDVITKYSFLVDPAWDFKKIEEEILTKKLNIVGVLITHVHYDHIDLAEKMSLKYDVPIYVSRIDSDYFRYFPTNIRTFEDASYLYEGNLLIQTLVTPGHTHGSSCFYIHGNLLTGDTLFIEGCGVCNEKEGDSFEMFASLQRIIKNFSDETLIFPGHKFESQPGVSLGYVKANNIYLHFNDAKSFSKFRNRKHNFDQVIYK